MSVLTALFLLALVAFSDQHCNHKHGNQVDHTTHRRNYANRVFEEVAAEVKAADIKSQELCQKNNNGATKESLETELYVLETPLSGFNESDVKIEIRHRILYVNAYKTNPENKYTEIREIPTILNTREAKFSVEDGALKVYFSLKNSTSCAESLDDKIINVPVYESSIQNRFGGNK